LEVDFTSTITASIHQEMTMGRDQSISCIDCKKTYYCGYGSYTSWVFAESISEFIKEAGDEPRAFSDGELREKNMILLRVLVEHAGHNVKTWSSDWCFHRNGDLYLENFHDGDIIIRGEQSFEQIGTDDD
jgi:hypothetical protein